MKIFNQKGLKKCVYKQIYNFKRNQIKRLNDEFNVDMFHTKVLGGKAFAAEQKKGTI